MTRKGNLIAPALTSKSQLFFLLNVYEAIRVGFELRGQESSNMKQNHWKCLLL